MQGGENILKKITRRPKQPSCVQSPAVKSGLLARARPESHPPGWRSHWQPPEDPMTLLNRWRKLKHERVWLQCDWCELRQHFRNFLVDRITATDISREGYPGARHQLLKRWKDYHQALHGVEL